MKHSIAASLGIFKNHMRWLLLLSNHYNGILNEPNFLLDGRIFPKNPNEKLDFIKEIVYPSTRTATNWLDFEWSYRQKLDNIMFIEHCIEVVKKNVNTMGPHKILAMTATPKQCMFGYMKFDPYLHKRSPIEFLVKMTKEQQTMKRYKAEENEEVILVDAFQLYNETLNEEFYNTIVNFFMIDNQYDTAKKLHSVWFNLQEASRKHAYQLINDAEYPEFPWTSTRVYHRPETKNQWQDIKNTMTQIYKEEYNA